MIETSVLDTGIGISKKVQEKMFERFVQSEDTLTRNIEGLGIGLSIVKKIIENHGGRVAVDAAAEKGTKVTFMLPV
jgi:signal transduction histidine kinase